MIPFPPFYSLILSYSDYLIISDFYEPVSRNGRTVSLVFAVFPSPGRFLRSRGRDVEITMILAGTRGANGVQQSKRA